MAWKWTVSVGVLGSAPGCARQKGGIPEPVELGGMVAHGVKMLPASIRSLPASASPRAWMKYRWVRPCMRSRMTSKPPAGWPVPPQRRSRRGRDHGSARSVIVRGHRPDTGSGRGERGRPPKPVVQLSEQPGCLADPQDNRGPRPEVRCRAATARAASG